MRGQKTVQLKRVGYESSNGLPCPENKILVRKRCIHVWWDCTLDINFSWRLSQMNNDSHTHIYIFKCGCFWNVPGGQSEDVIFWNTNRSAGACSSHTGVVWTALTPQRERTHQSPRWLLGTSARDYSTDELMFSSFLSFLSLSHARNHTLTHARRHTDNKFQKMVDEDFHVRVMWVITIKTERKRVHIF